ncbi:MAG TPA: 23S rRNA (uracil(1939)-C(5))-methyltransferase RlmD [Saprospiraceae bacterium]|nr:23S rRNA (uracil(1939)-C(5))-methyltransferase RlmD [Saprospiraceae bacterium]
MISVYSVRNLDTITFNLMTETGRRERKIFQNVTIIDTANDGLAMGRCEDGRIILVRHAVPGDIADVMVVEKRKGMLVTVPTFFHEQSSFRTAPFCQHFGICGGCKWQHMTYEAQLHFKEKTVHDAYQRIGGLDTSILQPIVAAPRQQYYRNKLEFTASDQRWLTSDEMNHREAIQDASGVGFHLPGSFDKVLDLHHCHLQTDPSNAIRLNIKQVCQENHWVFFDLKNKTGFLRNIILRNNLAGDWMVVIVVGQDDRSAIETIVDSITVQFPEVKSVYSCLNTKVNDSIHDLEVKLEYGAKTIVETLGHVQFHIGPKSFFQTNSQQAARLYSLAKKMAALKATDHVYDLYCGVGSLGLFMADQCAHVVGIEQIPEAIEDARANAQLNQITNAEFEVGQVERLLDPQFILAHGRPDVIITDPPRAGMHPDVIAHLVAASPSRIVYVSCNPSTQARDIKALSGFYNIASAVPVDMFPHTHHIECIALLQRG